MARRSDTKQRMVQAARQLIRERGYHATAISDVLERSDAPRGSVYFHFPGGKPELAVAAADLHAHEQVQYIDRGAEGRVTPPALAASRLSARPKSAPRLDR